MWTWISDWFWSKSAKTTLWLWPDIWCQLLVFTSQRYSRNQKHIEVWQLVRIIYELWAVHLFLFFSFVLTGVWEAGGRQTKHCFTRTIRELFCIFYPVNHLDKSVLFFFVELIQKKAENKKIQDEFNYYDWLLVLLWKYNNTSVHSVSQAGYFRRKKIFQAAASWLQLDLSYFRYHSPRMSPSGEK